jgi:hypothetical protein
MRARAGPRPGHRRHALGDAARQAQRVPHGQHDVTDLGFAGVAERGRPQARPVIDPDYRQVARRVAADQPCLARLRVAGELDLEAGRVPGHVGVGDDVALIV